MGAIVVVFVCLCVYCKKICILWLIVFLDVFWIKVCFFWFGYVFCFAAVFERVGFCLDGLRRFVFGLVF